MAEAGTMYQIDVFKEDKTPVKLQITREDGSSVKDFIAKVEQLLQRTGVKSETICEFAFEALCGLAKETIRGLEESVPSIRRNWSELKSLLLKFFHQETFFSQLLNKYEKGSVTKIIGSTAGNVGKSWTRMVKSQKACGENCTVCQDPEAADYLCRTMMSRSMLMLEKALIIDRLPDKIRPLARQSIVVSDFKQDIGDFSAKLLTLEAQYKTEIDEEAQVSEVNGQNHVEAVRGRFNNSNNSNNSNGNGNNGNGYNGNNNGGNNGYRKTNKKGKWNGNRNNGNNNGGNNGNNGNNGNRKRQIIFCFKCKNWGYHIAKECRIPLGSVTRKQYADVKPAIHEVRDPEFDFRKDEFESNQRVSREELQAATSRSDIPLATCEVKTQDFL